jgi:hypothetical protein
VKNFNLKKFLGEWFLVKILWNDKSREFSCLYINLTATNENSFHQVIREMYFGKPLSLHTDCQGVEDARQFCSTR